MKCRPLLDATCRLLKEATISLASTRHTLETNMNGYRMIALGAAILITMCEALFFVGATTGLN